MQRTVLKGLFTLLMLLLLGTPPAAAKNPHAFGIGGTLRLSPDILTKFENKLSNLKPTVSLDMRTWVSPKFAFGLHFGFNLVTQLGSSRSVSNFNPGLSLLFSLDTSSAIRPFFGGMFTFHILDVLGDSTVFLTVEPTFGLEFFLLKNKNASITTSFGVPLTFLISGNTSDLLFVEFANFLGSFRYYF